MQEVLNEIYKACYYKQVMFTTLILGFFVNQVLHSFFFYWNILYFNTPLLDFSRSLLANIITCDFYNLSIICPCSWTPAPLPFFITNNHHVYIVLFVSTYPEKYLIYFIKVYSHYIICFWTSLTHIFFYGICRYKFYLEYFVSIHFFLVEISIHFINRRMHLEKLREIKLQK